MSANRATVLGIMGEVLDTVQRAALKIEMNALFFLWETPKVGAREYTMDTKVCIHNETGGLAGVAGFIETMENTVDKQASPRLAYVVSELRTTFEVAMRTPLTGKENTLQ